MLFKGSLKIAKLFGIPVLLHWSFLLVIIWLGYYGVAAGLTLKEFGWICLFSVLLFLCILLHEFGHALTAKRYQVDTKDIILLPVGGLARLNKLPEKPIQEMLVAIAGPAVNIAIALILLPYCIFVSLPGLSAQELTVPEALIGNYFFLVPLICFLNILLAVFNLIPAFPMDGGRFLRAILSVRMGRLKATRIAVWVGQIIAAGMIAAGIMYDQLSFTLIGLFIYFSAGREYRWALTEDLLSNHSVAEVFDPEYAKVYLEDAYEPVAQAARDKNKSELLVFDESDRLAGLLPIEKRPAAMPGDKIKDFYQPAISRIQATDSLKTANEVMQDNDSYTLAVYEKGELVGVLESERMWDFIAETGRGKNK